MLDVEKKTVKSVEEYRHNIQLLKYHLKKEKKKNEELQYQVAKNRHRNTSESVGTHNRVYQLSDTVKIVSNRLKRMGLVVEDVFRMADSNYEGEITREQFMKVMSKLKTELPDSLFSEMFYAIDTSLNGLISEDEFLEFSIAYGGCSDIKEVRKYQNKVKSKLLNLLNKKSGGSEQFIENFNSNSIKTSDLSSKLQELGLNGNEAMMMMKTFDPELKGIVNQKLFVSVMTDSSIKTEKQQEQAEFIKSIDELCIAIRDKKLNPIIIFEEADIDGKEGVSPFELEQAFKNILPEETTFQIKKWVELINFNKDEEITKEEFLNSIRGFYSINQLNKFSEELEKKNPLKKMDKPSEESIEKILKKLSIAIEDKGMKRKEAFESIDINKSGDIDKQELLLGLESLGINPGLISQVIAVFDCRNGDGLIDLEEWYNILGEDPEMSEVELPPDDLSEEPEEKIQKKTMKKAQAPKKESAIAKESQVKKPIAKPTTPSTVKPVLDQKSKLSNTKVPEKGSKIVSKESTLKSNSKNVKDSANELASNKKFAEDGKNSKIVSEEKEIKNSKEIKEIKVVDSKEPMKKSESSIKNKSLKESGKSEVKKSIKKTESKVYETPSALEIEENNDDILNEEEDIVDKIEEDLGKKYKKNKKSFLKPFKSLDSKGKGVLSMKQFYEALSNTDPNLTENELKEIFMKNCVNGSEIRYNEWLEELAERYAEDIEEDSQQESEEEAPKKNIVEQKEKPKEKEKQEPVAPKEEDEYSGDFDEQSIENKSVALSNRSGATQRSVTDNKKRGEFKQEFAALMNLIQPQGKRVDEGYKLINYISDDEEQLRKERERLLKKAENIKKEHKMFVDQEFPPEERSLFKRNDELRIQGVEKITWKHYEDIYASPQLFQDEIHPSDIKQGALGDCYFLSALSGLAEYKNLIERLFEYYDLENGYFLIWMCIDGFWKLIEIDGHLPVNQYNRPAFTYSAHDELWVSLLEKTYAKCYGDYNKIVGGLPFEAIKDLSGSPGAFFNFDHKNERFQSKNKNINLHGMDEIFEKLLEAEAKNYIMTAGTAELSDEASKIDGRMEMVTKEGIVLGHAYTILDVRKLKNEKLIKLRNPWGSTEWIKGEWADGGSKWTQENLKTLQHEVNDKDGIFWMPLQSFFENFVSCSVNCIRPDFHYRSDQLHGVKQFAVKSKASDFKTGYFSVSYRDHRHDQIVANSKPVPYDGRYYLFGFVICEGKVLHQYPKKVLYYEREGYIEFNNMEQYPKNAEVIMLVSLAKTADVTIGFYGDKMTDFEIEKECVEYMQSIAFDEETRVQKVEGNPFKYWEIQVLDTNFICFKNTEARELKLEITMKNMKHVKMQPPFSEKNVLKIKPGEMQAIRMTLLPTSKEDDLAEWGWGCSASFG